MAKKKKSAKPTPVPAAPPPVPEFWAIVKPTEDFVLVDGLSMRVWVGKTEKGTCFSLCVRCCRLDSVYDSSEFDARFRPPNFTGPHPPEGVTLPPIPEDVRAVDFLADPEQQKAVQ